MRRVAYWLFAVCLAAGLLAPAAPAGELRHFEIAVRGGSVPEGQRVLRVSQGDHVEMVWTADGPAHLHLHGYDIEFEVVPGIPAEVDFDAHATGRFPVEIHDRGGDRHGHGALLYVEVYPD